MTTSCELEDLCDTMRGFICADAELLEALAIVAGTAEALAAEEREESAWYDAQMKETGAMRCSARD